MQKFDSELDYTPNVGGKEAGLKLSNFRDTFIALCKAGIGSGLLFTPYIFHQSGFIFSLLLLMVSAYFIYLSYENMWEVLNETGNGRLTMPQAVSQLLGHKHYLVVQSSTILFSFFTVVVYLMFILKAVKVLLPDWAEEYGRTFDVSVIIVVFLFYLPLSLKQSFAELSIVTKSGLLIGTVIFTALILNSLYLLLSGNQIPLNEDHRIELVSIPLNFGVVLFLYDVNSVLTIIRSEMEFQKNFSQVVKYYLIFICLLATFIGYLGSKAFGSQTSEFVFKNLQEVGIFKGYAANVLMCIYSLTIFVNILIYTKPSAVFFDEDYPQINPILTRVAIYLLMCITAFFFPSLVSLMNIIGCIFSIILGFVFPYLLIEKARPDPESSRSRLAVLSFGIIGGVIGVISTIKSEFFS